MNPGSLTIVLPAYNEEARLGPALDELFGYLRRHGELGRDGAPGAALLPDDVRVLVVDDGSSDGTAALVRARPEARETTAGGAPLLALLAVAHGGKGAAVKAGMLAVETDVAIFADADMATPPDQLPLLVEALRDHDLALGSRIQPDGSDMRRTQPGFRRSARSGVPRARVDLGGRRRPGHPVRLQGLHPRGRPGPVRPPAHHEHRLRRRADLPRPPARLPDRRRPDPLVGQARVADAPRRPPGPAGRVGPVPHTVPAPATCPTKSRRVSPHPGAPGQVPARGVTARRPRA